jgi:acetaldehyde dehydrogenase (acetylating)
MAQAPNINVTLSTPKVAVMRRDPTTAEAVKRLMNLPDENWVDIRFSIATDEVATADVTFLLTPEQVVGLAALCVDPAAVKTSDQRPHSRACGITRHDHGPACSRDCPTCGAKSWT